LGERDIGNPASSHDVGDAYSTSHWETRIISQKGEGREKVGPGPNSKDSKRTSSNDSKGRQDE